MISYKSLMVKVGTYLPKDENVQMASHTTISSTPPSSLQKPVIMLGFIHGVQSYNLKLARTHTCKHTHKYTWSLPS